MGNLQQERKKNAGQIFIALIANLLIYAMIFIMLIIAFSC